jgi:hypothetical protein
VRAVVVGLGHAVIHDNGYAPRLVPPAIHARGGGAGGGGETKEQYRPMFGGRDLEREAPLRAAVSFERVVLEVRSPGGCARVVG